MFTVDPNWPSGPLGELPVALIYSIWPTALCVRVFFFYYYYFILYISYVPK